MQKRGLEAIAVSMADLQRTRENAVYLLLIACEPTVLEYVRALVQLNGPQRGDEVYEAVAVALQEKGQSINTMDVRNAVLALIAQGKLCLTRELEIALPE